MAESAGERTEAPTPKRRKDATDKGEILKSRELSTALVVLAGVAWVLLFGGQLIAALEAIMAAAFTFGRADVEDFAPWRPLAAAAGSLLVPLGALFALALAAAMAAQAGLGSLRFNATLLAPKPQRINPASGLKRIFGASGWIELGKSLLKVALLGTIGAWVLWRTTRVTFGLASSNLGQAVATLGGLLSTVLLAMALGLVAIALVDVPTQLMQLLRKLRMSKQEIRDEHKESEGNPEVKGQQRARARAMLSRGARKAVAEAHVILTNPTHFAVALRYDRGRDQVPVVVAKGRGATALAIRGIAAEVAVPVLEYPALARAVYYTSREGQEVRDDLYLAIATVLAFVFGVNAAAGGTAVQPLVDVPTSARFDEDGVQG